MSHSFEWIENIVWLENGRRDAFHSYIIQEKAGIHVMNTYYKLKSVVFGTQKLLCFCLRSICSTFTQDFNDVVSLHQLNYLKIMWWYNGQPSGNSEICQCFQGINNALRHICIYFMLIIFYRICNFDFLCRIECNTWGFSSSSYCINFVNSCDLH